MARRRPAGTHERRRARDPRAGVVLINVLVTLALATSVVYAMISLSDLSIARSQRYSDAVQAQALIGAAEASLIAALRRDMAEAPDSDDLTEGWASIAQAPVPIAGGSFALIVEDAQSRLNLNANLLRGEIGTQLLARIVAALDAPDDVALRIGARLAQRKPLTQLSDLTTDAGLTPAEVQVLARLVTVLPHHTDLNLNTAPEDLIRVLTDNPVQAAALIGARARNAYLTPQDVIAAGLILPPGVGYASSWFRATSTVTMGGTTQQMQSLIQRNFAPGMVPRVAVVARQAPYRVGSTVGAVR